MKHRAASSLLLAALLAACGTDRAVEQASVPHIVVLVADDLGWNDVSWHGSELRTPNLDRLCAEGVELERFYVQPVCSPTRAAFLTGRYPIRYGMQIGVIRPWSEGGLPTSERLLSEVLRDAGYTTAISGKWHLGASSEEFLPMSRGFDSQYGHYTGLIDYWSHKRVTGLDWHRDQEPLEERGYATRLVARDAARRIEEHDPSKPLFLYVPFFAPHFPLQAPPDTVAEFHEIEDRNRQLFAGMIAELDRAVALIDEALESSGMDQNTLLLFFSDNGGNPNQGASNLPLRGAKNQVYEGGVRVPAFARWPERLRAGSKCAELLHVTDLFPTLAELGGGELENTLPLDGFEAWKTIAEEAPSPRTELLLNVEPRQGGLISGRHKLVVHYPSRTPQAVAQNPLAAVELFDIEADPFEAEDLSAAQPELAQRLLERLAYLRDQSAPSLGVHGLMPANFEIPAVWGPRGQD